MTTSGRYGAVLVAHGPFADAYSAKSFDVQGFDRVQGLVGIIKTPGYNMVADPVRPRVYAAGPVEMAAIDTESFGMTNIEPATGDGYTNPFLSISADASLLLVTNSTQQPPVLNRIDLESLTSLPPLTVAANASPLLEGLENHDFVSDRTGVFQFDRTTGETQAFIASMEGALLPEIALSNDRATLFVTQYLITGDGSLLTYDVTGAEPVLIKSFSGDFRNLKSSPDGKYLYYTLGDDNAAFGQLFRTTLPDLTEVVSFAATGFFSRIEVAPNGTIYNAAPLGPDGMSRSGYSLYDPVSLQETFNIDLNHFHLDPPVGFFPGAGVFDASGKYLFVSAEEFDSEVWAFSTDLGSFPVPVADPDLNLLNISTRVRVESGEGAMIGGFIIAGDKPKEVLIRGIGPSLSITGALSDPVLDLYDSTKK